MGEGLFNENDMEEYSRESSEMALPIGKLPCTKEGLTWKCLGTGIGAWGLVEVSFPLVP